MLYLFMSGKLKDVPVGEKHNKWTVVGPMVRKDSITFYFCLCDCGESRYVSRGSLMNGRSKSCGCWKREVDIKRHFVHGGSYSRLYRVWRDMKRRCYYEKYAGFFRYGGRGIKVCEEWEKNFENFKSFALSHGYKENYDLDRINNDRDYEPSNCQFLSRQKHNIKTHLGKKHIKRCEK